jgi:pyruvate formate lyase activating enzyme
VDNSRILENFKRAYETFPHTQLIARTPLIPGVNDDEEHIRAVLAFIRPHQNVIDYELLPYHRFGESKYNFLGRVYELTFAADARITVAAAGDHRRSVRPQQRDSEVIAGN